MIRWLLGFLADPRLLRLILCRLDNKPLPYTVEHAFNVRTPDGTLPSEGRELARAMLVEAEVQCGLPGAGLGAIASEAAHGGRGRRDSEGRQSSRWP